MNNRIRNGILSAAGSAMFAAALFWSGIASADVGVSNLGNALGDSVSLKSDDLATSFTTGDYETSLSALSLYFNSSTVSSLTVSIYSDNGGAPGSSLYSCTKSGLSAFSPDTEITFDAFSGNKLLSANTTYWVVVAQADSSHVVFSSSTNQTGISNWSIGDSLCYNSGASWTDMTSLLGKATPIAFEADVTSAVPEPASCAAAFGLLAIVAVGGRKIAGRRR
jgi:hypothetical protein